MKEKTTTAAIGNERKISLLRNTNIPFSVGASFIIIAAIMIAYMIVTDAFFADLDEQFSDVIAVILSSITASCAVYIFLQKFMHQIMINMVDIDHLREIEKTAKINEERLNLAMQATNDGLWDYNIATGKVYYSPSYYTMLGYEPYEMPEAANIFDKLLHPEDKEIVTKRLDYHMKKQTGSYCMEFRLKTKNGDWKWIMGRGKIAAWDDSGKPLRMVGTHTDISEIKNTETRLIELERKNSALAMAVTAAHEINQPLSVLKMSTEMFITLTQQASPDITDRYRNITDRINQSFEKIDSILRKYREAENMRLEKYNNETMMVVFDEKNDRDGFKI